MGQRGFTLIELLVVITIIGILAGMVIANTMSARRVARDRRRVSDVQLIHGAIQAYRKDKGSAPGGLSDLVPNYVQAVPTDPRGANYTYIRQNASGCPNSYYVVAAAGTAKLETTGIGAAITDQTCWSGDSPDNEVYAVTGR